MVSVSEATKEAFVDIAIPPEKFNIAGISSLVSKEFSRQPEEIVDLIIISSATKVQYSSKEKTWNNNFFFR